MFLKQTAWFLFVIAPLALVPLSLTIPSDTYHYNYEISTIYCTDRTYALSLLAYSASATLWRTYFLLSGFIIKALTLMLVLAGASISLFGIYLIDFQLDLNSLSRPLLAAELGWPFAQIRMSRTETYRGDPLGVTNSEQWISRALNSGSVNGEVAFYRFYQPSLYSNAIPVRTPEFSTKALKALEAAAHQGDPLAEDDLACVFLHGFGSHADNAKADFWLARSQRDALSHQNYIDSYYTPYCKQIN
jgi:hypothetical protein